MGVSKVVYNTENGEEVLVDLTSDSVTPETLAEGETAHGADGNIIVGTAKKVNVVQSTGSSTTDIMSQAAVTEKIDNLSNEIAGQKNSKPKQMIFKLQWSKRAEINQPSCGIQMPTVLTETAKFLLYY